MMPTYEEVDEVYEQIQCDSYDPERNQNGWIECKNCGQNETTHKVIAMLNRVRLALALGEDKA